MGVSEARGRTPPHHFHRDNSSGFATASLRTSAFGASATFGTARTTARSARTSGTIRPTAGGTTGAANLETNNTLRRNYPPPPARGPATAT
nr:MAG TPA: hypothetical protein [Caudoviricetes sp.]